MNTFLWLSKFLPYKIHQWKQKRHKFMIKPGLNVPLTTIARNSCPGICHHQTECVFLLQNRATDHTSGGQKTLYFIYCYRLLLPKRARNRKKNDQRNDCFQIYYSLNLSLPACPLRCEVQGCNVVNGTKETNSDGRQFQNNF